MNDGKANLFLRLKKLTGRFKTTINGIHISSSMLIVIDSMENQKNQKSKSTRSQNSIHMHTKNFLLWTFALLVCVVLATSSLVEATPLSDLTEGAHIKGKLRSFFQPRKLDTLPDQTLYHLGADLKVETGSWNGLKLGGAWFGSTDFGLIREDLQASNPILPVSDTSIFAEAYLKYNNFDTEVTVGRQRIETPFMNGADSLLFPVTFSGYSVSNKSIKNVELYAAHVSDVNLRQNDFFEDTDQFISRQLGISNLRTPGTTVVGAKWKGDSFKLEGWNYIFHDLYDLFYLEGDMDLPKMGKYQPKLGFQAGHQIDIGDSEVGNVSASLVGANFRIQRESVTASYAFNYIPSIADRFRNGGFLSPYSFATDAIYTNKLDGGLTVKGSAFVGWAHSWGINYDYKDSLFLGVNFTLFDLPESLGGQDSNEININFLYKFKGALKGLSVMNRIGVIQSNLASENLIEDRFMIQYDFDIFL